MYFSGTTITVSVQLAQKWLSGVSFASLHKVFLRILGVDRKTFLVLVKVGLCRSYRIVQDGTLPADTVL